VLLQPITKLSATQGGEEGVVSRILNILFIAKKFPFHQSNFINLKHWKKIPA